MSFLGMINESGAVRRLGSTLFGECTSAASAVSKVVDIGGFDTLITGITVHVRFAYANTASNPTLNVSNTGAYPMFYNNSTVPSDAFSWNAGEMIALTFDGNGWGINGGGGTAAGSGAPDLGPLTTRVAALESGKVDKVSGKALSTNDYSDSEKAKVAASVASIEISGTTVTVTKTDGTSFTIQTQDTVSATMTGATSGTAGIAGIVPAPAAGKQEAFLRGDGTWATVESGAVYSDATQSVHGLMSAADKTKLDGFSSASSYALAANVVTTPATQSSNGLMASSDKTKLDGFSSASNYVLKEIVATEWSGGNTYAEGAYVFYNGRLKKAIQDIPSSETTFVDAHWATSLICADLSSLFRYVQDLDDRLSDIEAADLITRVTALENLTS